MQLQDKRISPQIYGPFIFIDKLFWHLEQNGLLRWQGVNDPRKPLNSILPLPWHNVNKAKTEPSLIKYNFERFCF